MGTVYEIIDFPKKLPDSLPKDFNLNAGASDFLHSILATLASKSLFNRVWVYFNHKKYNIAPKNYMWRFRHKNFDSFFPIFVEDDKYYYSSSEKLAKVLGRLMKCLKLTSYYSFMSGKWEKINESDQTLLGEMIMYYVIAINYNGLRTGK